MRPYSSDVMNNRSNKWLPLLAAVMLVIGLWLGVMLGGSHRQVGGEAKLHAFLDVLKNEYVDDIDIDSLIEVQLPQLLKSLDPHSAYISAADRSAVNGELEGSFGGVGIQFQVINDTICVVEVISGGPAEKVGILPGDRIIGVDTVDIVGRHISDEDVRSMLRGEKDTKVTVRIKRSNSSKIHSYDIIRGDIPMTSVDSKYMLNDSTGYVKVNRFARNTYGEFLQAIAALRVKGANSFVIDLRGNGGGYMEPAILMANEFLPGGSKIVMTKGRCESDNTTVYSDGSGDFTDADIVVLIDEFSASASEIFAGAIQDNDRGLIIGRRSFGKGLVQRGIELPDSSEVRLTVQRYYTPSGRCIQKDFKRGNSEEYDEEIIERYNRGEIFNADSVIFNPNATFSTLNGRTVYGSGGIMPDIFVPSDTTGMSSYYINVSNAGLLHRYAYEISDLNREEFSKAKNVSQLLQMLPSDSMLLQSFVNYAVQNGVAARWHYINISSSLIVNNLKALIARDILGFDASFEIINKTDKVVKEALKRLSEGQAGAPVKVERIKKDE